MIDRLNALMDAPMDKHMLAVERKERGCEEIQETAAVADARILVGSPDSPMKHVIHMFPHTAFAPKHMEQLKKDYPEVDTVIASISRVYPGHPLVEKAKELGLNFVVGDTHALEIFENGVPMARAIKNHLPDVEVVIFRERQTTIPLDAVGSPEVREYSDWIAKEFLHRK